MSWLNISVNMIFKKTNKLKPQPATDVAVYFLLLTLKINSSIFLVRLSNES